MLVDRTLLAVAVLLCACSARAYVDPSVRVDCFPDPNSSEDGCRKRGCEWDPDLEAPGVPMCYFPQGTGYSFEGGDDASAIRLLKTVGSTKNPFDKDFESLVFSSKYIGSTLNIRIEPNKPRYEPPVDLPKEPSVSKEKLKIVLPKKPGNFSFAVQRESTQTNVWDTSIGGLLFGDKFIQIATFLPSDRMYGFGENTHQTIKHDFTRYKTWGMFPRDQPPDSKDDNSFNLYGVQPFYLALEPDGKAHGVLILNGNAQEITTGPGPHLIYRTIGGLLDIYFFPGPTPEQVVQQYTALVGKPFLPAYWALGYQLCRYGYRDFAEMKSVVERMQKAGIPLDVPYADIDYMDRYKDFTIGKDKGWEAFPSFVDKLHEEGLHVILIWDPAIQADYPPFKRGLDQGAKYIEWPRADLVPHNIQDKYPYAKDTLVMLGVVWPDRHVGFPDFLHNKTHQWWIDEFKLYRETVKFDGAWIDMNEPSNFGTNVPHPWYFDNPDHPNDAPLWCPTSGADAALDVPPYQTISVYQYHMGTPTYLSSKTLCMLAKTMNGTHDFYDTKSLYGWSESRSTQQAIYESTGKRGAVIARSTFPSSGRYAGHWLGDNTARWEDLRTAVIGVMEFNLFGIPYVGSDICGFLGNTTEELCLRWHQLGAFHSFSRNHNTIGAIPQDPAAWPSVAQAAKKANLFRYQYLPYLFTLHFKASLEGATVIRFPFFEFVQDTVTHTLDHQFMWGSAFMIIPVLYPGATTVRGYLPETTDGWYSVYDADYALKFESGFHEFEAPKNYLIPVFVRGRQILARQAPETTTTASRKNPFELLITSAPAAKGAYEALGQLYWDDGDTIVNDFQSHKYYDVSFAFSANQSGAKVTVTVNKKSSDVDLPALQYLEILGYEFMPDFETLTVNGNAVAADYQESSYSPFTKMLRLKANLIDAQWENSTVFKIQWNNQ